MVSPIIRCNSYCITVASLCHTELGIICITDYLNRIRFSTSFVYTPLSDHLILDVISVKAFPHFSAICCNCRFVNFNCFLSMMLFALELLPLRTLMPTKTEGILFFYALHFCARMHQPELTPSKFHDL